MKVIYGLGNPGQRYKLTRHNIGFMVLDYLSERWKIPMKYEKSDVIYGKGEIHNVPVMLMKPYTYMNLCGIPLKYLRIEPEDLIVVHDDMDIDSGMIRIKERGGTGGHKGLDSIIDSIGSKDFVRIRCGIGRPPDGYDPRDYVLSKFSRYDTKALEEQLVMAIDAIEMCLKQGITKAMNTFNRRQKDIPVE